MKWTLVALGLVLGLITGCGGSSSGSASTASTGGSSALTGRLTGLASTTGTNQAALIAPGTSRSSLRSTSLAAVGQGVRVRVLDTEGHEVGRGTTHTGGEFDIRGLPLDRPLIVILETQGRTLRTFIRIPRDARSVEGILLDPLAALISHRIEQIFRDRGLRIGELFAIDPALLAQQLRELLAQLRDSLELQVQVDLDDLAGDSQAIADLFDQLIPDGFLDAAGDPIAVAEAAADLERGNEEDAFLAITKRLFLARFQIFFSMDATPQPVQDWIAGLPPEVRFDGTLRDGTPWSGSGPCLLRNVFQERDINEPPTPEGPGDRAGGPFLTEANLQRITAAMLSGRRLTLPELHRILFRPVAQGGGGFVMTGAEGPAPRPVPTPPPALPELRLAVTVGPLGQQPLPYTLTGEHSATALPVDPESGAHANPRDFGAIEPPFAYTFGDFLGPVPNLQALMQKIRNQRVHVPWNPTGPPEEFVACKDDAFFTSGGQTLHPIRVNVALQRDPAGRVSGKTITESDQGEFFLGFTEDTHGDSGRVRFLRVVDLRELRTEYGNPLFGVRDPFEDLEHGFLGLGPLIDTYARTGVFVNGGPPVLLHGMHLPVVYDHPAGGRPVVVTGPDLRADGSWDVSVPVTIPTSETAGRAFLLGLTENSQPFDGQSEVTLVDLVSGTPIRDPGAVAEHRFRIVTLEDTLDVSLTTSYTQLLGGAIHNPRFDPSQDPYFDDVDGDGGLDPGEPSFGYLPVIPDVILDNFNKDRGEEGYLQGPPAYGFDPTIYSYADGSAFDPSQLPGGFDPGSSPEDNGLRLRRFRPRANGREHPHPMRLFTLFTMAFPPAFFDGNHVITDRTTFDVLQMLALLQIRFSSPYTLTDVAFDFDLGPGTDEQTLPALRFGYEPPPESPQVIMDRIMDAFDHVPE